ncbi:vankyrin-d8.4 [Ichnoviriform fugitivi]|uniref:Vankyrin-d8.4 n=1 Tax=Ichnoviriform fugitivi TaxID=265522 RepID=A2Q0M0_9VIRU|nr:vankyrin-d8.4 [Ichnoviriform fugitivi]BAF45735.1 vankyrin-d8.4 [Ichnoviriform fugitivi]
MNNSQIAKFFARNPITGDTIFHELAEVGSVPLLLRIRETTAGPYDSFINELNFHGVRCVHVAVRVHRGLHAIQVMEQLVKMGADLNAPDNLCGTTVLHDTVWYEDLELVTWLCQQPHINLDARRWDGVTAYQMAFMERNTRMKAILQANGANCEEPPEPRTTSSGKSQ